MFIKKLNSTVSFLMSLLLVISPLVIAIIWINNNQTDEDKLNVEIVEKPENIETEDPIQEENLIRTEVDDFEFTYLKSEGIIVHFGFVSLTNGCQLLTRSELVPESEKEKQSFVLEIEITDTSEEDQMCTQAIIEEEISGTLEYKFPEDFDLDKEFKPELFRIEKNIIES